MSNHGTPLPIGPFAKLAGTAIANLPREMDVQLALDFSNNGDALAVILADSLTRENLNRVLETLGKKQEVDRASAAVDEPALLAPVGTVSISATSTKFTARDKFVISTKRGASPKISYLGYNFKAWLLDKTEAPFAGSVLRYATLTRYSPNGSILKELGGEEEAETTLAELFALMHAQPNGESGPLILNGYANIFYIRDATGDLRTVNAYWSDDGWHVSAVPWRTRSSGLTATGSSPAILVDARSFVSLILGHSVPLTLDLLRKRRVSFNFFMVISVFRNHEELKYPYGYSKKERLPGSFQISLSDVS